MMILVHYDEAMIHLMQFSLVISHCNITFLLFRKILDRNWCYNLVNFVQFFKARHACQYNEFHFCEPIKN